MLAMFVGAIDQTVVGTATPKILADLGGFNLLAWLFTSYMLSSTVIVPLVGKMSDIYGRKMFVITGIIIFTLSSAACGAAPTMLTLIIFRAVQGIGGGMIFASVFSSIGDIFPPAERAKYMGLFTGTFSLASILGPTVGGFLTDHGNGLLGVDSGWRWVFYINVPFSLIAIPAIWFNLPSRHGTGRPKIDFLGAGLLSVASVVALLAFEWAGKNYDWSSPQIIGLFVTAVVFVGLFILQEARHPEPILPLHLFRNRTFVLANALVFALGMGMMGSLQYLGIFVQTALGASATASGVISTPQSAGMLVASIVSGQLIARSGKYRVQTILGSIVILAAMLLLRTLDVGVEKWSISGYMVVLGVGFGLVMPTMSLAVQNAVPYKYLGVASSSSQFFRQIGSVFGIAIFALILTSSYESAFRDKLPAADRAQMEALPGKPLDAFEDPTLSLNPVLFAAVQKQVLSLDGGQEILGHATTAQRESVASATRDIFTGATAVALICVLLCMLLKEVPLRRDFKMAAPAGAPDPEADDSGESRGAEAPLPAPGPAIGH
jgi:EmrB/QacA subfamily drug resistance transporter